MNYTELENAKVQEAIQIVTRHLTKKQTPLTDPSRARALAQLHLSGHEHEVFCVMWLDTKHYLIQFEQLFRGTIDGASVYPREIVKTALARNAAAAILVHNHPSGVSEPSSADVAITQRLKSALALIDVRVLDHLIVGETVCSLAECGKC